jgi:hypothetical protein
LQSFIGAVALQNPGSGIVREKQFEISPESFFKRLLLDRKTGFVTPEKIPLHPVGTGAKELSLFVILEIVDAGVFEKPTND